MYNQYRVWLHTLPGPCAQYDGHVDVYARSEEEALSLARQKLTGKNGTFFDRAPGSFVPDKIEIILRKN